MATYYVSPNGSNSNNGLGPDAAHASNKPWLTVAKALGSSGIASGDTVYIAPGVYRESITVSMISAIAETFVVGDPQNSQGFKDGSGTRLSGGPVILTVYTTSDTTAPSANDKNIDLNGRAYLTFERLWLIGAVDNANIVASTSHSHHITLRECVFDQLSNGSGRGGVSYTGVASMSADWLIERCLFMACGRTTAGQEGGAINIILPTALVADYDVGIVVRNCVAYMCNGADFVRVSASGSNSFKGGGIDVVSNSVFGGVLLRANSNIATSSGNECTARNNLHSAPGNSSLVANTSGQILESYNRLCSGTPRTNVTAGAGSVTGNTHAVRLDLPYAWMLDLPMLPMWMPTSGSPLLGFGNESGAPSVDMWNRPRPAGGASTTNAVGAAERHHSAVRETSVVRTGTTALKIIGPGDHEFQVPIDAASTTISVWVRFDTNHGTANRPQMILTGGAECGVSDQTITATGAIDTWEQLTTSAFTPVATGIVTVRLVSRAAVGSGIAYWDDASVT